MSQILESLSSSNFIRSHRSFIVNIDYIDSVGASNIKIASKKIPLGNKYKQNLLKNLNII